MNHSQEKKKKKNLEMEKNDDKDVSLQELRVMLAEFAEVRGWDQYHSPRNLLLALVRLFYL